MKHSKLPLLTALGLLPGLAGAQTITPVVTAGDSIPGIAPVDDFGGVWVGNGGKWAVELRWSPSQGSLRNALLVDGDLVAQSDGPVYGDPSRLLNIVRSVTWNGLGESVVSLALTVPTINFYTSVWRDGEIVIEELDSILRVDLGVEQTVGGVLDVQWTGRGDEYLAYASTCGAQGCELFLGKLLLESGVPPSLDAIVVDDQILPGQTGGVNMFAFFENPRARTLDEEGSLLALHSVIGLIGGRALYLDDQLIAQIGSPSPVAGRTWSRLNKFLARTASGGMVYGGDLDGDPGTARVLIKDDSVLAQQGHSIPAIAPFVFTGIDATVRMDNAGRALWSARWSDPDPARGAGLFLGERLIAEVGVTEIDGSLLASVQPGRIDLSPDGLTAAFTGALTDGRQALFFVDLDEGSSYCGPAGNNSTGVPGALTATGSALATVNNLTLMATDLPANQFGIFLASRTQGFTPGTNGTSDGNLCLAGAIGRFVAPGQIMSSGTTGRMSLGIDLSAIPEGAQFSQAIAGENWNFQTWHRDASPLGSNFTNGVAVTIR